MALTPEERWCAGRKFARSSGLGHVQMYWVPSIRGVIARSIGCKNIFRLPAGSVPIGEYANPFNTEDFLSDLDDVIAQLDDPINASVSADERTPTRT